MNGKHRNSMHHFLEFALDRRTDALGRRNRTFELRIFFFQSCQFLEQRVVDFVRHRRSIIDVISLVMLFKLLSQLLHTEFDCL